MLPRPYLDHLEIGQGLMGEKETDLGFRQTELGVGQNPEIFFNGCLRTEGSDFPLLPQ